MMADDHCGHLRLQTSGISALCVDVHLYLTSVHFSIRCSLWLEIQRTATSDLAGQRENLGHQDATSERPADTRLDMSG